MRLAAQRAWSYAATLITLMSMAPAASARQPLRVASKAFTESVILAEIATQLERAAGVEVEHRSGLGGTRLVWNALLEGSIDVYPEYTGTLLDEVLSEDAPPNGAPEAARNAWLEATLKSHGVGMTAGLGFNNTYAIGLTVQRARTLGVSSISELAQHPELQLGLSNEFMSRRDGWPALQRRYQLPQTNVRGLDHDLAYRALQSGSIDATDLYTTDAEIRRYALLPLTDDRAFFKRYDAILLYRLDVESRWGSIVVDNLRRLDGQIDTEQMVALNARAKLERVAEAQVAADFLHQKLGVAA